MKKKLLHLALNPFLHDISGKKIGFQVHSIRHLPEFYVKGSLILNKPPRDFWARRQVKLDEIAHCLYGLTHVTNFNYSVKIF